MTTPSSFFLTYHRPCRHGAPSRRTVPRLEKRHHRQPTRYPPSLPYNAQNPCSWAPHPSHYIFSFYSSLSLNPMRQPVSIYFLFSPPTFQSLAFLDRPCPASKASHAPSHRIASHCLDLFCESDSAYKLPPSAARAVRTPHPAPSRLCVADRRFKRRD